ncbi:MAG: DUF3108 domain-containing protein [Rhodobacteraceae bacterium]|nr:DUF3108 domain-containing protein [Paracoccaceae bacterium]
MRLHLAPLAAAAISALVSTGVAPWASANETAPKVTPVATTADMTADLHYTYDFYLSGVPVAVGKFQASIEDTRYNAVSALKTVGIVGLFFDTEVVSSADGQLMEGEALSPALFEMRSRTKDKRQDVKMVFADDAPETVEASPPFRKKRYEIDPAKQNGALDPMSAIVAAFMPRDAETVCSQVIPVFDARKRYDVKFHTKIREYEEDGRRFIECKGVYERLAGFKPKMMKKPNYPFKIRFAVNDTGAPRAVRIWGDTYFGVAVALLRE